MLRPTADDLATRPIMNRNPWKVGADWPRSRNVVNQPAAILENSEQGNNWTPHGLHRPAPYIGGHDGLEGRMMHVSHADLYDSSPNPWPNNGQYDRPNSIGLLGALLRLAPHTSAHPGFTMGTKRGDPTSLFNAPPAFGTQTVPIPALGV